MSEKPDQKPKLTTRDKIKGFIQLKYKSLKYNYRTKSFFKKYKGKKYKKIRLFSKGLKKHPLHKFWFGTFAPIKKFKRR